MDETNLKKNPSRATCEEIIRRILMTEVLEKGTNHHFKTAADFMKYFESLYPAGPGLTKQVQRAVKSLHMPKDDGGYFIINKTEDQLAQDEELRSLLHRSHAFVFSSDQPLESLFLSVDSKRRDYLYQLFLESATFQDKFVTIVSSSGGLLFYTQNRTQLVRLIENLLGDSPMNSSR